MLPRERTTADHRVIGRILQLSFGKKNPPDGMINMCSDLFGRMRGSWVGFFDGDPDQVRLLKQCIKAVVLKEKKEAENERRGTKRSRENPPSF